MKGGSVTKRYATALIRVAKERGHLPQVQKDLETLAQVVEQNPRLKEVLESPVIAPSRKKSVFAAIREKLGLGDEVNNLMRVLIDQERVDTLALLNLIFRDSCDEVLGQIRVKVQAAVPLGDEAVKLQGVLEKTLGKKVLMKVEELPGLIGGMVVQVGDKIFDGSLKKELEDIKETIVRKAVA
jgi:F-type H+-transporting ATPase subunit delta